MNDTGYLGIQKLHANNLQPKKKSKKKPLSDEDKRVNRQINAERVVVEHVIRRLKIFKILSEKYRNRRRKFGLRLNLIASLYNQLL
jgi:DDE superfamily endonuclease